MSIKDSISVLYVPPTRLTAGGVGLKALNQRLEEENGGKKIHL